VALARPTCLYCGAALASEALAALEAAAREPAPGATPEAHSGPERVLLVGMLEDAAPERLVEVLGGSLLEARQLVRRRGPELLRVREAAGATAECQRLASCGARVRLLAEAPVRRAAEPWIAVGGRQAADGRLSLRATDAERVLEPGKLLLLVQGRIQREYQPRAAKRLRTATLEQGYRIHLHLRDDERPVELNPGGFEFDAERGPGSSLLRLRGWLERLAPGVAVDDRFRFLPAALGPEEPAGGGTLGATRGLRRRGQGAEQLILDNLRQFRFYSAWRGAWERAETG
jgi:hypothetical protein